MAKSSKVRFRHPFSYSSKVLRLDGDQNAMDIKDLPFCMQLKHGAFLEVLNQ